MGSAMSSEFSALQEKIIKLETERAQAQKTNEELVSQIKRLLASNEEEGKRRESAPGEKDSFERRLKEMEEKLKDAEVKNQMLESTIENTQKKSSGACIVS